MKKIPLRLVQILALAFCLSGTAAAHDPEPPPPKVVSEDGDAAVIVHEGEASYYGPGFDGKPTASGETFDRRQLTAASPHLPLGVKAEVTNTETGESVEVLVNDRGPFAKGRVIDLSEEAARRLDMMDSGAAEVRVVVDPRDQPTAEARKKAEEMVEELPPAD